MKEQNLLKLIIEEQSWEDLIYHIVSYEGLNPWDIDIIKLADSFLKYVEKLRVLDFRIPAKVVLVAAILLKIKCETLYPFKKEEEEYFPEEALEDEELRVIKEGLKKLDLRPPIRRIVRRKVTLNELIDALKKAVKVEEKKERRKILRRRLEEEIGEEEDIEKRIEELMKEIESLLSRMGTEKIGFSSLVKKWERDEIVRDFLPLLHLSAMKKVKTEQERLFDEIFISKV